MESNSQSEVAYQKTCSICMELLYLPHMFPKCEHTFCKLCIQYIEEQEDQLKCPLCRTPQNFQSIVPLPRLEAKIKKDHPEEYEDRRKAYEKELSKIPIGFIYGNTSKKTDRKNNSYDWRFFFKSKSGKVQDYVEKVQLQLHPTFHPSRVPLTKAPFEFRASGWGTFQIGVKVFWKPNMGGSFSQYSHMLEFESLVEHKFTKRQQI